MVTRVFAWAIRIIMVTKVRIFRIVRDTRVGY